MVSESYTMSYMDYVGLTSQVQVQQENHNPTWLIKTGSAEKFHKLQVRSQ